MLWQNLLIFLAVVSPDAHPEFGFLFFALLSTGVSLLLEACLGKDMILGWWYVRLVNLWTRLEEQHDSRRLLLKPFGLCITCYSVWISIFTYYLFFGRDWLYLPFFCGLAYLWLRITQKLIH